MAATSSSLTYYEVLQVPSTASALDIKKAYRRLALKYHPDRNAGTVGAKERFQQVGEAYQCLSDTTQRRLYDQELEWRRRTSTSNNSGSTATADATNASPAYSAQDHHHYQHHHDHHRFPQQQEGMGQQYRNWNPTAAPSPHFNPYAQFDELFQHDPFFRDYFESDDAVQQEFANLNMGGSRGAPSSTWNARETERATTATTAAAHNTPALQNEGWVPWLLRQCGISFHITTVVQDADGNVRASRISNNHRNGSQQQQQQRQQTVQQETNSYIDPRTGQRITVRRRQYNGQVIQETLVQNQVVERQINGVTVDDTRKMTT